MESHPVPPPQERVEQQKNASDLSVRQRMLHYLRQSWQIWLVGLVLVGGGTSLFMELAEEVMEGERFAWDAPIMLAVYAAHQPWLDVLMIGLTHVGYAAIFVLGAIGVVWLWRRRRLAAAMALFVSVAGSVALNTWLKLFYLRPRPEIFPALTNPSSTSFPSGHAMGSVAFYGLVAYFLWRNRRRLWAVLSVIVGLLVSFSRVYLGVHYPSDIVGALAVGVVWLTVVIAGYRYYNRRAGGG